MDRNRASEITGASRLAVALRKESVDRNVILLVVLLSSIVALRKESVDRNILLRVLPFFVRGRSPQGERG